MKIAYYTDQTYLHGGIEKILSLKANYFSQLENFDVIILTNEQQGNTPCYQFNNKIKHVDLSINYNRNVSNLKPENFIKIFKNFIRLRSFLMKYKPDVLIVCNYSFDYFFIPFINKRKTLKIKEIHDSRHYGLIKRKNNKSLFRKFIYAFNDFIARKYDYIVVLNQDEKKYYKGNNIKVIPNFLPARPVNESKTSIRKNVVIAAGRLSPVKGFDQLINAWERVSKKAPDWELHFYGNGTNDYVEYLNSIISDLGLHETVKLMGSTSKLHNKLVKASIYAMSSITECFPMVLMEAMQARLPIVSYNCPNGPKNIITDQKDGILVKNQDVNALSKALTYLIRNEDKRRELGRNGKINVKRFNDEIVMNQWITLFNAK